MTLGQPHVQISPKEESPWSFEQLKRVAQIVLNFEEALKLIVAPSRRDHPHAKRNNDLTLEECCKRIQGYADISRLTSLLQPKERTQYSDGPPIRDYAWNVMNTMEPLPDEKERIGTIGALSWLAAIAIVMIIRSRVLWSPWCPSRWSLFHLGGARGLFCASGCAVWYEGYPSRTASRCQRFEGVQIQCEDRCE